MTDLDAVIHGLVYAPSLGRFAVERKNCFILIEAKKTGEPLLPGQRMFLEALSRIPQWRVVVLTFGDGEPISAQWLVSGRWTAEVPTNREEFSRLVSKWFHRVNGDIGGAL